MMIKNIYVISFLLLISADPVTSFIANFFHNIGNTFKGWAHKVGKAFSDIGGHVKHAAHTVGNTVVGWGKQIKGFFDPNSNRNPKNKNKDLIWDKNRKLYKGNKVWRFKTFLPPNYDVNMTLQYVKYEEQMLLLIKEEKTRNLKYADSLKRLEFAIKEIKLKNDAMMKTILKIRSLGFPLDTENNADKNQHLPTLGPKSDTSYSQINTLAEENTYHDYAIDGSLRIVKQSSTLIAGGVSYSVENGVDKNFNTCVATKIWDENPWYQFEYDRDVGVKRILITPFDHVCCKKYLEKLTVIVDGKLCNHYKGPGVTKGKKQAVISCNGIVDGRKIRIFKAGYQLNFCEITVDMEYMSEIIKRIENQSKNSGKARKSGKSRESG